MSEQCTPADTSRSNTVASTSKRPLSATATATRSSAATVTYQVVPPKRSFFFRTPYLVDPALSRLGSYLDKTDDLLRRENAITVNGYPREFEEVVPRQIRTQIEVYTTETYGIIVTICNENGEFQFRSPNEFDDPKMKGCSQYQVPIPLI